MIGSQFYFKNKIKNIVLLILVMNIFNRHVFFLSIIMWEKTAKKSKQIRTVITNNLIIKILFFSMKCKSLKENTDFKMKMQHGSIKAHSYIFSFCFLIPKSIEVAALLHTYLIYLEFQRISPQTQQQYPSDKRSKK